MCHFPSSFRASTSYCLICCLLHESQTSWVGYFTRVSYQTVSFFEGKWLFPSREKFFCCCNFTRILNSRNLWTFLILLFFCGLMPFHFCVYCEVSKLGVLYPELAFDCVLIACSLESIRPGLVQGYKAPNGIVGHS